MQNFFGSVCNNDFCLRGSRRRICRCQYVAALVVVMVMAVARSVMAAPVTLESSAACPVTVTNLYPKGLAGVKAKLAAAQTQAAYLKDGKRAICFALQGPVVVDDTVVIDNASGVPLVVFGLSLKGGALLGAKPALEVRGTQPVTVQQLTLSDAPHAIVVSSSGHAVVASTLTGTTATGTVGIDAAAVSNTSVQQVTLRNFERGLRVGSGAVVEQVQVLWDYVEGAPVTYGTTGVAVSGGAAHLNAVTVAGYATGAQLQGEAHVVTTSLFDGAPAVPAGVSGAEAESLASAAAKLSGQVGLALQGSGHQIGGGVDLGNTVRRFQQGVVLDGSAFTVTHNTLQQLDTGVVGSAQTATVVVEPNTFAEVQVQTQLVAAEPAASGTVLVGGGGAPSDPVVSIKVGKSCTTVDGYQYRECVVGTSVDGINAIVPSEWCVAPPGNAQLMVGRDSTPSRVIGSCSYQSANNQQWILVSSPEEKGYLAEGTCLITCRDGVTNVLPDTWSEQQLMLVLNTAGSDNNLAQFQLNQLPSLFMRIIETPLSPTTVILAPIGGAMGGTDSAADGGVIGDAATEPIEMLGPATAAETAGAAASDVPTPGIDNGSAVVGVFAGDAESLTGDGVSLNTLQTDAANSGTTSNQLPTPTGSGTPTPTPSPPTLDTPTPGNLDPAARGTILATGQVDGAGATATAPLGAAGCSLVMGR